MCLIIFAYKYHPGYPLILVANRDEYYNRPTAPAQFWDDCPDVLAGRDLVAGGTWLGVSRTGRFAALTNYRDPSLTLANPRSRGHLVSDYLCGNINPANYMDLLAHKNTVYNGFNLIAGNSNSLWYYSNIEGTPRCLLPGLYGVSNHLLDTPWPKVKQSKEKIAHCLQDKTIDNEALFQLLADCTPAADDELPNTGVSPDWERILSPVFITSPEYGTRSSTILTVDLAGKINLSERTYHPVTGKWYDLNFSFQVNCKDKEDKI